MYAAQFAQLSVLSFAELSSAALGASSPPAEHAASVRAVAPAPAPASRVRRDIWARRAWRTSSLIIGSSGSCLMAAPCGHAADLVSSVTKPLCSVCRYWHIVEESCTDFVRKHSHRIEMLTISAALSCFWCGITRKAPVNHRGAGN